MSPAAARRGPGSARSAHRRRLPLALLLVWLLCPGAAGAAETVRLLKVIDGDSLVVSAGGRERELRLDQIDAPEYDQPHGQRSEDILRRLLSGRPLSIEVLERDRYGREVVELEAGGVNINARMVELGAAWAYRRYLRDESLLELEATARAAGRGLWGLEAGEPVAPWTWRHSGRAGAAWSPSPVPPGAVIGNRRSGVYHLPHCPSYDRVSPRNRVPYASVAEAEAAGLRRAGNCP